MKYFEILVAAFFVFSINVAVAEEQDKRVIDVDEVVAMCEGQFSMESYSNVKTTRNSN